MLLILTNNVNKVTVVKSSAVKTRPRPRLIASVQFSEAVPLQLLECWWLCSVTSTIVTVVVTVVASKSYCFKTLTKTSPHGACADISLSRPKPTFCSHWITCQPEWHSEAECQWCCWDVFVDNHDIISLKLYDIGVDRQVRRLISMLDW